MRATARFEVAAIALAAGIVALASPAWARACGPDALGVKRQLEIDAKGGPRLGLMQYPGRDILEDREVVLTFDDGPHKLYTRPILDALDRHCTKATFFMVGQRALGYPDLALDVANRGHTVGTHTWSHADLAKTGRESAISEIELGISAVQKIVGKHAAPFFRFPYLSDPGSAQTYLKSRDTAIFSIDVDSYDFRTRSPTKVVSNVMRQLDAKGRGIILFHDIQPSTAFAINDILSELKRRGFRVVHLVPRQSQTTVADFDRRVPRDATTRVAAVPVSQRGAVSPAWESQVHAARERPPSTSSYPAAGGPPPARPLRPMDDNWFNSIFKSW
jgi:peptidoglycan-N-acetylglucosamine deacetylase